ncbi:hypothetical protein FRC08_018184 [Ceratobasidium sp. 394]|nr:hypothetical protein FRC08_018184 [Ceratobasidium sp. 394]KAG9093535.1 hypothetical protein FS749_014222 [Ceratobasidium sp. UAMH 11750]
MISAPIPSPATDQLRSGYVDGRLLGIIPGVDPVQGSDPILPVLPNRGILEVQSGEFPPVPKHAECVEWFEEIAEAPVPRFRAACHWAFVKTGSFEPVCLTMKSHKEGMDLLAWATPLAGNPVCCTRALLGYIPLFLPKGDQQFWQMQCEYVRVLLPKTIEIRVVKVMGHSRGKQVCVLDSAGTVAYVLQTPDRTYEPLWTWFRSFFERRNAYCTVPLFATDPLRNGPFPPNVDSLACRKICLEEGYPLGQQSSPQADLVGEESMGEDSHADADPGGTLSGKLGVDLFLEEDLVEEDAPGEPDPDYMF